MENRVSITNNNPITPFLERQGALILDGGLATELEARGYNLGDELWSARLLQDAPEAIRQVHADYLAAGADCVISASYQATIGGFVRRGLSEAEAIALLRLSVQLALEARDDFWAAPANRPGRLRPLVAASVGPYGAALADGSEYTGAYDLDEAGLLAFHRRRWHILAETPADLLACETIPSYPESRALARLLAETPGRYAWFSFSCRDGQRISDGTPLVECIRPLNELPQVAAVGVNCTAPRFIPSLIARARQATDKPIVVYPNSGETYDAKNNRWLGESVPAEFGTYSREWRKEGAALIGGCCRTGPEHIRQISDRFRR
ncbi:MAG: homocysteine S-methyltransferase [Chloroflexi bacterium]|nr:homocysteine S-methyltransferase [Chloroflexota bacterium]MCI0579710.1 homocysteine S-methyltransferase [Chloroflexota bacterium]MCI0644143.1 homocysteine S-methyltransferase [Chloroflexota bacterium]MCI0726233.1 homocysteine S-methyltransferase [Chloroflexota bacterium]